MYFIAGGDAPGTGALYQVEEVSRGQAVSSTILLSGLTGPTGLTHDFTGHVFVTETLPFPEGKIKKATIKSRTVDDYIVDLDYPTGIAVDSFNQVYVVENGKKRVTRLLGTGKFEVFRQENLGSPEVGQMDAADNLYLLESDFSVVSRIDSHQNREVISPAVKNIRDIALDASDIPHILVVDMDLGIGEVLRVVDANTTESVVGGLINPTAIAFDSANALYISEGSPANRITRYVIGEEVRRVIVTLDVEPNAITFTPY